MPGNDGLSLSFPDAASAATYKGCVQDYVEGQNEYQSTMATAYQALMGIIGVFGYIQQYQLLQDQLALQERTVDQAQDYLTLAQRQYDEVTRNAYDCMKGLFIRFTSLFQACELEFIEKGKELEVYDPDYKTQQGRAMSTVQAQMDRAQRRYRRGLPKFATGRRCHADIWFSTTAALARVDAANTGYRYEDDKKVRLDGWYWDRCVTTAQFVENMRAHVVSATNGGVTNVAQGLQVISGALGGVRDAAAGASQALSNQASFFGTLANGAFRAALYPAGREAGGGIVAPSIFNTGTNAAGIFGQNSPGSAGVISPPAAPSISSLAPPSSPLPVPAPVG